MDNISVTHADLSMAYVKDMIWWPFRRCECSEFLGRLWELGTGSKRV